jgi:hypothetical protein
MTVVVVVPMPSRGTSSPRRVPPILGPNSSPTLAGHWRNAKFLSAYRRQTWWYGRRYWQRSWSTACIPPPPDGWDLSAELDKAPTRVGRIDGEHATEAERLSWQVIRISGVLVNLGMLPI